MNEERFVPTFLAVTGVILTASSWHTAYKAAKRSRMPLGKLGLVAHVAGILLLVAAVAISSMLVRYISGSDLSSHFARNAVPLEAYGTFVGFYFLMSSIFGNLIATKSRRLDAL